MLDSLLESKESFLLMLSTPLYALFILAEMIYSAVHNKQLYTTKDTLVNVYLSSLNFGLDILVRVVGFFIIDYLWLMISLFCQLLLASILSSFPVVQHHIAYPG